VSHQLALTSLAARDSIREKAPSLRERIYAFIGEMPTCGATRDEIENHLHLSGNTVRPRVRELIDAGRIYETKETRLTRSGRNAFVLRARL
jgi:predicted transcriptional regulator